MESKIDTVEELIMKFDMFMRRCTNKQRIREMKDRC